MASRTTLPYTDHVGVLALGSDDVPVVPERVYYRDTWGVLLVGLDWSQIGQSRIVDNQYSAQIFRGFYSCAVRIQSTAR